MVEGLLGQKIGMTYLYSENGYMIPVTVVEAGPCWVVQVKTTGRDRYEALQLSFQEVKEKKVTRPLHGHCQKAALPPFRYLREIRGGGAQVGDEMRVDIFAKGERVDVTGISKGKGFAGVVKRYHFRGGPATHGSMFHRAPGSIGSSSYPSRVLKNKRLPGRMGGKRVTAQGLEVVEVRREENILFLRGSVPGSRGTFLLIRRSKK